VDTVDWHFCPHCETQLDAATFICPACRWDPLAPTDPKASQDPDAQLSLTERYRGTQYSTAQLAPALVQAPASQVSKVRTIVVVGLVLLLGMYGAMLVYTDFQTRPTDRPAVLVDR
jgi:hypothetical protein